MAVEVAVRRFRYQKPSAVCLLAFVVFLMRTFSLLTSHKQMEDLAKEIQTTIAAQGAALPGSFWRKESSSVYSLMKNVSDESAAEPTGRGEEIDTEVKMSGHTNTVTTGQQQHHEHQHQQPKQRQKVEDQDLLLTVPFYIYQEFDWLSDTSNATIGYNNLTLKELFLLSREEKIQRNYGKEKDDSDIKFYLAATKHPMRVERPEDAKLFLVPTLSNIIGWHAKYGTKDKFLCNHGVCSTDLLRQADDVLKESTWFQRSQGYDHIVLMTSLYWDSALGKRHLPLRYFRKCNALLMDNGEEQKQKYIHDQRIGFNTFFLGTACAPIIPFHQKTNNLAMIGKLYKKDKKTGMTMKHASKNFLDRVKICNWTKTNTNNATVTTTTTEQQHDHDHDYSMSVCGLGEQCPALATARTGFHVRGDTLSANRLFDTLLSGTVPIFTLPGQFASHQSFVDWHKLSYFLPMGKSGANKTIFQQQLDVIVGNQKQLEEKTQLVVQNRDLFDWETLVPFDTYMYMFQAQLWPETRVNHSKYSALILPPQLNINTTDKLIKKL